MVVSLLEAKRDTEKGEVKCASQHWDNAGALAKEYQRLAAISRSQAELRKKSTSLHMSVVLSHPSCDTVPLLYLEYYVDTILPHSWPSQKIIASELNGDRHFLL